MTDRQAPPPPIDLPRPPRWSRILAISIVSVLAPVMATLVLTGVVMKAHSWRAFSMPSGSMQPALVTGDYLFVDQRAYAGGYRPGRGEIIAFYPPVTQFTPAVQHGRPTPYIKRVVGLPGEEIVMISGVPTINGTAAIQTMIGEYNASPQHPKARRLRERLPGGATYEILKYGDNASYDSGSFVVPANAYFVLGDNRDDSLDSRARLAGQRFGWYVPLGDVIGRADLVYWSGLGRLNRVGISLK